MKCEECIYFVEDNLSQGTGECRRYPPRIVGQLLADYESRSPEVACNFASFFPSVGAGAFCGEFKKAVQC